MKKLLILSFLLLASPKAFAAAPALLGEYGDWLAYSYKENGNPVCYMASTPKKDEGKYTKRGDIYVVITHRPKDKSYNVVNFVAGYEYKSGSPVTVKIGSRAFNKMFTDGDKAWAIDSVADKELVEAMKKGDRMIVDGVSSKGTQTKDTYSLRGFSAAHKAISAKCK